MSKIGVGVGEEFPVDEHAKDGPEVEDLGTCHSRNHDRHQAWRKFRRQMHDEWHARRRAFRDALGEREAVEAVEDVRTKHIVHLVVGGLAVVGIAAILGLLGRRN